MSEDDRGAAALAERLHDSWQHMDHPTYKIQAAYALGERGRFLPDGNNLYERGRWEGQMSKAAMDADAIIENSPELARLRKVEAAARDSEHVIEAASHTRKWAGALLEVHNRLRAALESDQ